MQGGKIPIVLNPTIYSCILDYVCIHIIHHYPHICKHDINSYFIRTIVLNRQGSPCYPHPTHIPAKSLQTYLQTFISPSCLILSNKEEYYHRFFLSTCDRDPKQGRFYLRASFEFNYPLFSIPSFLSLLTFYPSAINTLSVSQLTIKISILWCSHLFAF